MVLLFVTIAVPIQLEGHFVSIFWILQTCLLFTLGVKKQIPLYQYFAYPLFLIALVSLWQDWEDASYFGYRKAFFNSMFATNLVYVFCLGWLANLFYRNPKTTALAPIKDNWKAALKILLICFTVVLFYTFFREINLVFSRWIDSSAIDITGQNSEKNPSLIIFNDSVLAGYFLLFLGGISFLNLKKFKDKGLADFLWVSFTVIFLCIIINSNQITRDFRDTYFRPNAYFQASKFLLVMPYVFYGAMFYILKNIQSNLNLFNQNPTRNMILELVTHGSILLFLGIELDFWLDKLGYASPFSIQKSILWGLYALVLIFLGIRTKKKHLRLASMALFGVTLVKLFVVDLIDLSTLEKTLVLVSLGILLLLMSYVYNKFFQDEKVD
ncbi:MAG: hypothetical protein C4K58_05750 [Flavobacteriaceae bacterium]|nr:MAG: hypothetical protein C4K58_05750 [Flavobacteriaceae bacterium]